MQHHSSHIVLDIGGEGRHPHAWNINRSATRTLGQAAGEPIPRVIVARADNLPFPDNHIQSIIVERTPVTRAAAHEISRVIQPGGQVVLRHVPLPDRDRHGPVLAVLRGEVRRRSTKIHGQMVQETTITLREGDPAIEKHESAIPT